MSSNYYMYRQLTYAKLIFEKGFQSNHLQYELKLLALYLRDCLDMKPKARKAALHTFCRQWIPSYSYRGWYQVINRAMNYSSGRKHVLLECPSVTMYKSEVEYIDGLDISENGKRTVWAIMAQKKLDKASYEAQHGGEYQIFAYGNKQKRINGLKRVAGLKSVKDMGLDVFQELVEAGLVEIMACKGDPIKLNFAEKIALEGEMAVEITDYEQLGSYWEWLHGDSKVGLCKVCGTPYRKTRGNREYCDDHTGYRHVSEVKKKTLNCTDCGQEFMVDARNHSKIRCAACQRIRDNARKNMWRSEKHDSNVGDLPDRGYNT